MTSVTESRAPGNKPGEKGPRLLHEITPRNFLSFGPATRAIELRPLNVLIGPNGSGKSNLIEAIALMRSTHADIAGPLSDGGGAREFVFKGRATHPMEVSVRASVDDMVVTHGIGLGATAFVPILLSERVSTVGETPKRFSYRLSNGVGRIGGGGPRTSSQIADLEADKSILTQIPSPEEYPALRLLHRAYRDIRIYRDWEFGVEAAIKQPERSAALGNRLNEHSWESNLALVVNRLSEKPDLRREFLDHLRDAYDGIDNFGVRTGGGTAQLYMNERGIETPIMASRLSDGTLRYAFLLAILCDPSPPPLICIEEPELGLHPDLLPKIADLLVKASSRTQLVVTTHSEVIVDALTETPESVLVCEKRRGETVISRLSSTALKEWLVKYGLGELWTRGDVGGNRW